MIIKRIIKAYSTIIHAILARFILQRIISYFNKFEKFLTKKRDILKGTFH